MLANLLLLLSILFPLCQSSGYIELTLKSVIDLQNATFNIVYSWYEREVHDISLVANKTRVVTGIPVNFTHVRHMFINTGPLNKYGFHRRQISLSRFYKKISTEKVDLPFTGLKFERVCDRNWYGLKCDYFCNNNYASIIGRRCTQDGKVGCPLGFHGSNCDQPIDEKASECQCQNDGLCVSRFESPLDSKDDLICECPIGWDGGKCAREDHPGWTWHYTYDENGGHISNNESIVPVDNEFYER